jgi:hypothetical protein
MYVPSGPPLSWLRSCLHFLVVSFSFYCLVLLGGQYMHESFAATFCAVAASLFGFWKVALVTAFQVRAALSGISAATTGANKIITPLVRGLYISAVLQEICALCFYLGIWGASDYAIKISTLSFTIVSLWGRSLTDLQQFCSEPKWRSARFRASPEEFCSFTTLVC